jgi:hypothetical protein
MRSPLFRIKALFAIFLVSAVCACRAQNALQAPFPGGAVVADDNGNRPKPGVYPLLQAQQMPSIASVRGHWTLFLQETFGPLSAAGTIFNAGFSQLTNSDPRYGRNGTAFGQRIGASAGDIASQNLFGDFLVASAFHEDPRYMRRGEDYSLWDRFGYAISRAAVIRTTSGGSSFNWDNLLGSAMSAGFSNLYYPSPSRTLGAMLIHFGTDVVDTGFVNLAPEFWPDFRRKVLRLRHHEQP